MHDFLSEEERITLKAQHKKERDKRICDRIKAVLLFDEGWLYPQIAHVLLLSDEAVRQLQVKVARPLRGLVVKSIIL